MLGVFGEERLITGIMVVLYLCGVAGKILLGFMYRSLIRETDSMSSTQNKLLKQCKAKFINCCQMNGRVTNVPIFVDKFLGRLAIGPFTFSGINHFSGEAVVLSVAAAGVGICKSIGTGKGFLRISPFYIACFLGLYFYFSVSSIVNINEQKRILKVNLVDYLENHLAMRVQTAGKDMELLYGTKRVARDMGRNRQGAVKVMEVKNGSKDLSKKPVKGVVDEAVYEGVQEKKGVADKASATAKFTEEKTIITGEEIESLLQELLST